jgi:hypothetical protein
MQDMAVEILYFLSADNGVKNTPQCARNACVHQNDDAN